MSVLRPIVRPVVPPIERPVGGGTLPWEAGGGAPALLDPLTFDAANLVAQWRADSGVTLSTTKVTTWVCRVSGRTITQAVDANRPTYNASSANFGAKPSVTFVAASTTRLGGSSFASVAQPYHMSVVCKFADAAGTETLIDDNGGGNTLAPLIQHNATDWQINNGTTLAGTQARSTSAMVILCTYNSTSSAIYTNSNLTTALQTGDAGNTTWQQLRIGANNAAANPADVEVAEVNFHSSLANLATWRTYWLQRYGISTT